MDDTDPRIRMPAPWEDQEDKDEALPVMREAHLAAPRYWGPLDVPARIAGGCFVIYAALRALGWW